MQESLEKLKSLDPTTYKRFADEMVGENEYEIYSHNLFHSAQTAWLQACLQEAISGKGYMFSVSHIWARESLPAYHWKAHIFIDPDNIIERRSDLPARALLDAYIAACEAMT